MENAKAACTDGLDTLASASTESEPVLAWWDMGNLVYSTYNAVPGGEAHVWTVPRVL